MEPTPDAGRPSEGHLDRRTCLVLLEAKEVGRIVLPGAEPFIAPLNYILVDEQIVFRTAPTAHAADHIGETVLFEIDTVDLGHEAGWSIVVHGVLDDLTDQAASDPRMDRLQPWPPGHKARWLGIRIDEISGRWLQGRVQPSTNIDERGYL